MAKRKTSSARPTAPRQESVSTTNAPKGVERDPSYQEQQQRDTLDDRLELVFGDSGTRRWGGFYFEEYNPDWERRERVDVVEEMRRSDATVKAALRALKTPLQAARWDVTIKSEDEEDLEICEFVKETLFGMRRCWSDFLREALCYLDFGHYVFELVWEKRGGRIVLADLEPRIPHSILRWKTEEGGFGIQQIIQTDEYKGGPASIPAEKLLILTNEKEGDDVTGQSVLRAAYAHFVYKTLYYKIQGISAERFGVGIPVIKPGSTAGADDKAAAEEWGKNMRANEQAYLVLPTNEWEATILTPEGRGNVGQMIENGIDHHNKQILMSILATFLALGDTKGGGGGYSLSQDKSSFFVKSLEQVACDFQEQLTNQVIKKLVKLNFGDRDIYPCLTHSPVGDLDLAAIADTIKSLVDAGMLKPDVETKVWVRDAFGLPAYTEEQVEAMREAELEEQLSSLEGGSPKPPEGEEDGQPAVGKEKKPEAAKEAA